MVEGTEVGVFLERERHPPIDVPGGTHGGCEVELREAVEVRVEDRVHDEIVRAEAPADDRADLAREAARLPVRGVVAQLEIHTVEKASSACVGDDEERPQLRTVEQQRAILSAGVDR